MCVYICTKFHFFSISIGRGGIGGGDEQRVKSAIRSEDLKSESKDSGSHIFVSLFDDEGIIFAPKLGRNTAGYEI